MGEGYMKKSERREYMAKRARELAESGEYEDHIGVEIALRAEGFSEARQYLNNRFLRQEIDEMCHQARSKR